MKTRILTGLCAIVALAGLAGPATAACLTPNLREPEHPLAIDPCPPDPVAEVAPPAPPPAPLLTVRPADDDGVLRLSVDVLFPTGKSVIDPAYHAELDWLAYQMRVNRQLTVRLEGRADSVGTRSANHRLSHARAEALREALLSRGVRWYSVDVSGYGEDRPVAPNDSEAGRRLNRRGDATAEITVGWPR